MFPPKKTLPRNCFCAYSAPAADLATLSPLQSGCMSRKDLVREMSSRHPSARSLADLKLSQRRISQPSFWRPCALFSGLQARALENAQTAIRHTQQAHSDSPLSLCYRARYTV